MQKVQGDTAALVAAALTQAEMTVRASVTVGRVVNSDARRPVVSAYSYYLQLVTTGEDPARQQSEQG